MNTTHHTQPDLAIFINELHGCGAQRMIHNLARNLCDRGFKIDIVVANEGGELECQIDPRVRVVCFNKPKVEHSLFDYAKYLDEVKPPRVMATVENSVFIALLGTFIAKHKPFLAVRMANTLHRPYSHFIRHMKYIVWRFIARHLYKRADLVVALSDHLLTEVRHDLNCKNVPVEVIYNPVPMRILTQKTFKVENEDILPAEDFFVTVGRLDPQKDQATMVNAMALVNKKRPCSLLILGEGKERQNLEALAKSLGIEDKIHMPGFVNDPIPYIKKSIGFVMTSRHEGMSNALLEGLGCGVPIVCTDCPHGPKEVLAKGKFGALVPMGDEEAVAEALLKVLEGTNNDKPTQAERLAHLQNFSEDFIVNKYCAALGLNKS